MRDADPFEIHFAERSLEQARFAFNKFMEAAETAMNSFEGRSKVAQAGAKETGKRIMNFAEQNVANAFDYAQKLLRTKDPQTLITLHGDFVQRADASVSRTSDDGGRHREQGRRRIGLQFSQCDSLSWPAGTGKYFGTLRAPESIELFPPGALGPDAG